MDSPTATLVELLQANLAALFALIGVLLGGLVSYLAGLSLSKRDLKLRLREKILDKRINAHERVNELSKSLRTMVNLGIVDAEGDLVRIPRFLVTKQEFREYQAWFSSLLGQNSTWLSMELTRELNLVQDYFVNLDLLLRNAQDKALPSIGNLIREDFVAFSGETERLAYSFFEKYLEKLKLSSLSEWYKYPRQEIERRLNQTQPQLHRERIRQLATPQ